MNSTHASRHIASGRHDWASYEHWPKHADQAHMHRAALSRSPDQGSASNVDGAGPSLALGSHPDTILRERQVILASGLGRSSIWAYANPRSRYYDPNFPKPIRLGVRAVGWRASEVFRWIAARTPAA